jgi:hypothetical protein
MHTVFYHHVADPDKVYPPGKDQNSEGKSFYKEEVIFGKIEYGH